MNVRRPTLQGTDASASRWRHLRTATLSVVAALLLAPLPDAGAEETACKREIARADARFSRAKMKALQQCFGDMTAGKRPGPCPDASTSSRIFVARAKLQSSIAKRCGGIDQTCSVTPDNDSLPSIGWDIGGCPNFESGNCTNNISHCGHISTCLLCINDAAIDQAVDLYYNHFLPTTDTGIRKCQIGLGKEASKFFQAKNKILGKCEDMVLKGSITGPCPGTRFEESIAKAKGNPWDTAKGFDHSAPVSDLHRVSEVGHPTGAGLRLSVNGAIRQQTDTSNMLFNVAEIIHELSLLFELKSGDLIFTGTPSGVALLDRGDHFHAELEGVATLKGQII